MKEFFLWIAIALLAILTTPICIACLIGATILWPIFFVIKLFDALFKKDTEQKASNKFEEFIFVCYGLCALCLLFPFDIIMND